MNNIISTLKSWLPLGIAITLILGTLYFAVQQSYRENANDPQIQVVEDFASSLSTGKKIDPAKITSKVNLKDSLSPFIMFFDKDQKLVASTAILNGSSPALPSGVLDEAKKKGDTQITWQPEKGARSAIVVKYYSDKDSGYVVSGRSIREVEKRIQNLTYMVLIGWLITMIVTYISVYFTINSVSLEEIPVLPKKKK